MVETLLTFYLLLLWGFSLKKLKVFKSADAAVFVNFVLYFALPLVILTVIHDFDFSPSDAVIFLTAWACILFTYLVLFKPLSRRLEPATAKSLFLTAAVGNTAFVGYPIAYSLFGEEGLAYAIVFDVVGNFLAVITFGVWAVASKTDLGLIYRFPPLGALILAFLLKPLSLKWLAPLAAAAKGSLTAVVVFALGVRFEPARALSQWRWALAAVLWRQFLVPLLVFLALLLLKPLFDLPPTEAAVILLQSSMPPFMMSVILSERFRLNADLALAAVNLGLALLPLSLFVWLKAAGIL